MTRTQKRDLACPCGGASFSVRIDKDEQVGLLTCSKQHHLLLLDSRDYWGDVIQDRRPRELRCKKCKATRFSVSLEYAFDADGSLVRQVDTHLRCKKCRTARIAVRFEIDYGPTDALVKRPLDPIEDPWLNAKRVSLSALWLPADLEKLVDEAARQGARLYFAGWNEQAKELTAAQVHKRLREANKRQTVFDLFFAKTKVRLPSNLGDVWKRLPVVHIGNPTRMNYRSGEADLYFVEYAEEIFEAGLVVSQPASFLTFARALRNWLQETFISERGTNAIDNPAEYKRLEGDM